MDFVISFVVFETFMVNFCWNYDWYKHFLMVILMAMLSLY